MNNSSGTSKILIAEDDADDRLMIKEAFEEGSINHVIDFVEDGHELVTYLENLITNSQSILPSLILLDLNMPRKDGREALRQLKQHTRLKQIPIVVLTTSKSPEDIRNAYQLGANCYVTKPVTFEALLKMVDSFNKFWFDIVRLPH